MEVMNTSMGLAGPTVDWEGVGNEWMNEWEFWADL